MDANWILAIILGNVAIAILLALSISIRKIPGKFFLVFWSVLILLNSVGKFLLDIVNQETTFLTRAQYFQWAFISDIMFNIAFISLAMFIFSIWSSTRIKMTTKDVLFSFNDRIPRSVFWIVYGILFAKNFMIGAIFVGYTDMFGIGWAILAVDIIWLLISIWMSFALLTKRWHDLNRSGWMSLLMLIPIIGPLLVLGWCGFTQGDVGPNEYGEDPFYREIPETNSL